MTPTGLFFFPATSSRHHHAAQHPLRSHRHLRAVVETADDLTFRTLLDLVGGQMQACRDERVIEHAVLFAASYEGEAGQVGEHSPCAILSVEPEQGTCRWELGRCEGADERRERLAQFCSVASVASIAKTAEPVGALSLRNPRARSDDLPALAPRVARGTHVISPPKGRRQVFCLWQGPLTGRLTRAIDIKDSPGVSHSIH